MVISPASSSGRSAERISCTACVSRLLAVPMTAFDLIAARRLRPVRDRCAASFSKFSVPRKPE